MANAHDPRTGTLSQRSRRPSRSELTPKVPASIRKIPGSGIAVRHTRPKCSKTRKSYSSLQIKRGGTPNGDSKSARHSENSQLENGREFLPLEAQKSLAVRRRTNGGKTNEISPRRVLNRRSIRSPRIIPPEVWWLKGERLATSQPVRSEPLRNPLETTLSAASFPQLGHNRHCQ